MTKLFLLFKINMRGKRPHVKQNGGLNNNAKSIITPFGQFSSIRDASISLNIEYKKVWRLLNSNKHFEWKYVNG